MNHRSEMKGLVAGRTLHTSSVVGSIMMVQPFSLGVLLAFQLSIGKRKLLFYSVLVSSAKASTHRALPQLRSALASSSTGVAVSKPIASSPSINSGLNPNSSNFSNICVAFFITI